MTDVLQVDVLDHVLVMTMNRPRQRNCVDQALATALGDALDRLDADPTLLVGVLTGGPDVFCAGTDFREGSLPETPNGGPYGIIRRRRSTPLIAAVEGYALGGGMEIVLACDVAVAGDTASFGLPEVKRGVVAACAGIFRGPRSLPPAIATELLLTGDPIDAQQAAHHGLLNRVVPTGGALDAALELARSIARNSPAAVAATLAAIEVARAEADAVGWPATEAAVEQARQSPDWTEGVQAFLEKRDPRWSIES